MGGLVSRPEEGVVCVVVAGRSQVEVSASVSRNLKGESEAAVCVVLAVAALNPNRPS